MVDHYRFKSLFYIRAYEYYSPIFGGWGRKHPPNITEAFQLLPSRHLTLHHNCKDSLANETDAVE